MLGEEYLGKRKKLESITSKIKTLALKIDVPSEELETDAIKDQLESPIRIMVCGEKGAGKTAFLSALVGRPLIASKARAIQVYGSKAVSIEKQDQTLSYDWIRNLGDIELIDTCGIGELNDLEIERIKLLMQRCDYVLWILSSSNPWASKTWDFIGETRELVGDRSALILQQIDLRPPDDVPILLDHLRSLCIQRAGHVLAIHTVSATMASAAWSQSYRDPKRWKISGFEQVETRLAQEISTSKRRDLGLKDAFYSVKTVIDRLEDSIQHRVSALRGDKRVLQAVEAEVERERESEVKNARENLNKLGSVVSEEVLSTVKYARKKNGVIETLISLFTRGDGAVAIERRLQESVGEAAAVRAREIAFSILRRCEKHWQIMRPELQRKMAVKVVDFDTAEFQRKVDQFADKMEHSTRRAMVLLKLRRLLDRMMVMRQVALKRALIIVLSLISAASLIGFLSNDQTHQIPSIILIIAAVLVLWMFWYGNKTKNALINDYADTIVGARLHLAEMITDDYKDAVRVFFTAYFPMFDNIRHYIVEAESDLEPKQKECHELFLMIKAIEQDL